MSILDRYAGRLLKCISPIFIYLINFIAFMKRNVQFLFFATSSSYDYITVSIKSQDARNESTSDEKIY